MSGSMAEKEMRMSVVAQEQVAGKERKVSSMFSKSSMSSKSSSTTSSFSSCGINFSKAIGCALTPAGHNCHPGDKDEFTNVEKLMSCYLNV